MRQRFRVKSLADFVNEEMARRKITMREFARITGVSHSTLSRIINEGEAYQPTWDVVVRLAKSTHTDIRTLAAIIAPDAVTGQDARSFILAERIGRLPPEVQDIIDGFINDKTLKHANH